MQIKVHMAKFCKLITDRSETNFRKRVYCYCKRAVIISTADQCPQKTRNGYK